MSLLGVALKPLVWPLLVFIGLLLARWGAITVYRLLPAGRLKDVLLDKTLLDRHGWIQSVIVLALVVGIFWYVAISFP